MALRRFNLCRIRTSRRKACAFAAIVIALFAAGWLAWRSLSIRSASQPVHGVPPEAQAAVASLLAKHGYIVSGAVQWAGNDGTWRAPGRYRLYFAASAGGSADIFAASVTVDAGLAAPKLAGISRITDTPGADETSPVLATGWLAFAARVGSRYQSLTCLPLADPRRAQIYVFDRPADQVELAWVAGDGRAPLLQVRTSDAAAPGFSVSPEQHSVTPPTGLAYTPARQGEMPWIASFVSHVRDLPGVGPEKIAFIENVAFTALDFLTRTWYGIVGPPTRPPAATAVVLALASPSPAPTPPPTAGPTPAPLWTASATPTFTPTPALEVVTLMASAAPVSSPRSTDLATATPTAPPTATASPTSSPTPTVPPTPSATPLPPGQALGEGLRLLPSVFPDAQRPYAEVSVVEIDPSLLQLKMVPGTWEPRPSTGLVGSGVIPTEDWPSLVAAFNGGFAAMHGHYGMMVDRKVYLPALDGVATIAVYEDGSIRMGTWGVDITDTPDLVSYRQNCMPLITNGTITAETGKFALWGLSVANEVYLFRSGLGVRADGKLVYVAGRSLSAYTLAKALQMAGAVYAMQLDVDECHVVFITYDVQPGAQGAPPVVTGKKLRQDMHGFDSYFLQPFALDFFYLTRRAQPLAAAVRLGATPQPQAEPTSAIPALPGHIAFASNRDGNWELYSMPAAHPEQAKRLTNEPADDLDPAWSPDGKQLAFASRRGGNSDIYVLDINTGSIRQVTRQPSDEWAPAWSPDGTHLAYQSDRNGQADIYTCALDGSDERLLTPVQGNNEAPAWSPDGSSIAFDSDLDVMEAVHASINLYLMNADGSNQRRIMDHGQSPAWSPDGRALAFTIPSGSQWQVGVLGLDGSGYRLLTSGAWDSRHPTWSPDGKWVAYACNRNGRWDIYAVPAAGGEPIRLTAGPADNSYPSWGK